MFWASPGPASHSPFQSTATSVLLLSFSLLTLYLLPFPQLGTVSLQNHRARFCHWVSQVTEVEIHTVVVSAFASICKFLVASCAAWDRKCPRKLQKPLRHTTAERGELMSTIYELEELLHLFTGLAQICCIMWATFIFFSLLLKSTRFPHSK